MTPQNGTGRSVHGRSPRSGDGDRIEGAPGEDEVAAGVRTFATLGNDTRDEALRLLMDAEGGVCVCEMDPTPGASQSALSRALSRLFAGGLVERRTDGRCRYYAATPRARRLLRFLDETGATRTDG